MKMWRRSVRSVRSLPSVIIEGVKWGSVVAPDKTFIKATKTPLSRLYEMFMRIAGYEFRSRPHTSVSRGIPFRWELWCWQINNWKIRIIPELSSQNFKLHKSPTKTERKMWGFDKLLFYQPPKLSSFLLACASQICFCQKSVIKVADEEKNRCKTWFIFIEDIISSFFNTRTSFVLTVCDTKLD